jgi:hypothetical protein
MRTNVGGHGPFRGLDAPLALKASIRARKALRPLGQGAMYADSMPERHDDDEREDEPNDEPPAKPDSEVKLKPVSKRIGEERDNLRRRRDWFKRRTGSDQ